jgi:thioredoxin reductase
MSQHDRQRDSCYDVAVIGGGAAGLSAALVLTRACRAVVVVDAGTPRNGPAHQMHGYLSRDGFPPAELLSAGRHEVCSYGGDIVAGTATDLVPDGAGGFAVRLGDGQRIRARRLLVTTGLRDELPDIPGLRSHEQARHIGLAGGGGGVVGDAVHRSPLQGA